MQFSYRDPSTITDISFSGGHMTLTFDNGASFSFHTPEDFFIQLDVALNDLTLEQFTTDDPELA